MQNQVVVHYKKVRQRKRKNENSVDTARTGVPSVFWCDPIITDSSGRVHIAMCACHLPRLLAVTGLLRAWLSDL